MPRVDDTALPRTSAACLASGVLATIPMSGVMLLAGAVGVLGTAPPRHVVDTAVERAPGHNPSSPERDVLAAALHLGLGGAMALGILPVRARLDRLGLRGHVARGVAAGAVFGTALYALNYAGLAPALGILPPPTRDRPGRQPTMLVAHLVYGLTLGVLLDRVTPPRD